MNTTLHVVFRTLILCAAMTGLAGCAMLGFDSSEPERVAAPPQQEPDESVSIFAEADEAANAEAEIRVRETVPKQYTVKKGDTLWDISSVFLKDPWFWPEIWNSNPQVENPHLIYPGDILTLVYIGGRPQILVNQAVAAGADGAAGPGGRPEIKLSPRIRKNALQADIPSIPGAAIRQFLTRPRVISKQEFDNAPYIIGSDDERLVMGQDTRIYVRGELDKERLRYTVFRAGEELVDPESGELLGYEAIYAGEAVIDEYADPARGKILTSSREILMGDRLLPTDKSKINNLYFPKVPDRKITGSVVSLFDGLFGVGQYQVVVLNRGDRDGVELGTLFASYKKGKSIRDRFNAREQDNVIELPSERSGLMMVFRTFDQVSYALVLESTNVIRPADEIRTPN